MAKPGQLTPKQKLFVKHYLVSLNASEAARQAGYSPKTAMAIGGENLGKPMIQAAIAKEMEKRAERVGMTADFILEQYRDLYAVDAADLFDDDGSVKALSKMTPAARKALAGIEVTKRGSTKVKMLDRLRILRDAGSHVGVNAFRETVHVSAAEDLVEQILTARKRAKAMAKENA